MRTSYPERLPRFWWFIPVLSLLISSCSPLRLVSNLSDDDSSFTVNHQSYGDNERHQLDIYMPEQIEEGSPVVVFFYGGSWKRGERDKYGFVGHSLSSKGYVTVIPDYRLYPEVTFPAFVEDAALAISWLRANIDQAENGVVVMGHSAGAHIAALLALDKEYLEDVGQPQSIIRGMIGLAGPYGFDPRKYRSTRPIFSGVEPVDKAKPLSFACSAVSPLLLLHGVGDSVVVAKNSRELSRRIDSCGGNVEYIELAEANHMSIVLGLSNTFLRNKAILSPIDIFLKSISRQQTEPREPSNTGLEFPKVTTEVNSG